MFGIILVLTVLLTSLILENKSYAPLLQLISSCLLLLLINAGGILNKDLLATQFVALHATVNVVFLTMVIVAKILGINGIFGKALKQG